MQKKKVHLELSIPELGKTVELDVERPDYQTIQEAAYNKLKEDLKKVGVKEKSEMQIYRAVKTHFGTFVTRNPVEITNYVIGHKESAKLKVGSISQYSKEVKGSIKESVEALKEVTEEMAQKSKKASSNT